MWNLFHLEMFFLLKWFSTNKYINLVRNLLVLKFLRQADDWI